MEITLAEALELINEIRKQPDNLFEMIRANAKQSVGRYMSELMNPELTDLLGRDRYQRIAGKCNHRNGAVSSEVHGLRVSVRLPNRIPRDRNVEYETSENPPQQTI